MALVLNQVACSGTAVLVATVTPNSTITLSVPSSPSVTVYVGQSLNVTTTTGFPINPGGPQVSFFLPPTAQAVPIYAITGGSAGTIGVALLTTA
jgi:hypothetical protein